MTKEREALKLALEALDKHDYEMADHILWKALAQPEFTKHEVVSAEDWSEWVCPDPQSYLMKCCDCGLLHEAQFKVVRYKSEDEREECDPVNDPNLQAVFRMRRSEQWSPKDTAYRPGGLAQPEQEPVAWRYRSVSPFVGKDGTYKVSDGWTLICKPEKRDAHSAMCGMEAEPLYTAPPHRKPLTDEEIMDMYNEPRSDAEMIEFARAIEAAHGIKE